MKSINLPIIVKEIVQLPKRDIVPTLQKKKRKKIWKEKRNIKVTAHQGQGLQVL